MLASFVVQVIGVEVDGICAAGYGEQSPEWVNSRNGYRLREWDTRAATIELAIPRLRSGSYFPEWLSDRRRRAEQTLNCVVATSYLLGVSTRRVDKLVEALDIIGISKSQVGGEVEVLDGICAAGYGEQSPARRLSPRAHLRPLCHGRNRLWLVSQGARGSESGARGDGLAAERRSVRVRAATDCKLRRNHGLFPTNR